MIEAAIGVADAHGIGGMSMRRLAQELGVEAMTLYYYVANKDEILVGMVDRVVELMELPAANGDWKAELRSAAISAHDVLVAHPWAANLLLAGPGVSQARLRHMDRILGCLRGGGFSPELTDHAYHALDSPIMGFTLWQVGIASGLDQLGSVESFVATVDDGRMPHLVEHIRQHLDRDADAGPSEFEFGLDLLLEGLERRRDA